MTQEVCIKAVDSYPSTIQYVPDWYQTQEMRIRAVNTCSFVFGSVPYQYNTQQICIKAVDYNPSTIKYDPDQYKTQKVCVKLLIIILMHQNFSLMHIRLKICLIKLFIIMLMHYNLLLIKISRQKFMIKLFLKIFIC